MMDVALIWMGITFGLAYDLFVIAYGQLKTKLLGVALCHFLIGLWLYKISVMPGVIFTTIGALITTPFILKAIRKGGE